MERNICYTVEGINYVSNDPQFRCICMEDYDCDTLEDATEIMNELQQKGYNMVTMVPEEELSEEERQAIANFPAEFRSFSEERKREIAEMFGLEYPAR